MVQPSASKKPAAVVLSVNMTLRHILTKKATKRKRHLRPKGMVSKNDLVLVTACLPYA